MVIDVSQDVIGGREHRLGVRLLVTGLERAQPVRPPLGVEQRSVRGERRGRIDDGGELVDLDEDLVERVLGLRPARRHEPGRGAGRRSGCGGRRPASRLPLVAEEPQHGQRLQVIEVVGTEERGAGRRYVEAGHHAVRDVAPQHRGVEHAGEVEIVDESRPP